MTQREDGAFVTSIEGVTWHDLLLFRMLMERKIRENEKRMKRLSRDRDSVLDETLVDSSLAMMKREGERFRELIVKCEDAMHRIDEAGVAAGSWKRKQFKTWVSDDEEEE